MLVLSAPGSKIINPYKLPNYNFYNDLGKERGGHLSIQQNDAWEVINQFFRENGLVSQQIDSFNSFLGTTLQEIVQEVGQIKIFPSR